MTPKELSDALVETESLTRKPIAISFIQRLTDLPKGVPEFGASASENGHTGVPKSMLCAMWGDALAGAGPFYTVKEHHVCGGGAIAAGFGSTMPVEAAAKFMIGEKLVYGTMDGLKKAMASTLPFDDGAFEAQVISPLEKAGELGVRPGVVFIVCKPVQGQHILRAFGYDSGEVVYGIGGTSTCEMVSSYVMKTDRPTFTLGDLGGNTGLRLADDEVIVAFPYAQLETAVKNLLRICRDSTMYKHNLYHELPVKPLNAPDA